MKKVILILIAVLFLTACETKTTYPPNITPANVTNLNETNTTLISLPKFLEAKYGDFNIFTFYFDSGATTNFIIFPNNETMLVDINSNDMNSMITYIKDLGFIRVNYIVLTSESEVYSSGAEKAITKLKPSKVYHNGLAVDAVESYNIEALSADTTIDIGDVKVKFYIPYDDGLGFINNANNLMVRFEYGFNSFLLGSCTGICEERIPESMVSDVFILNQECETSLYMMRNARPSIIEHADNICEKELNNIEQAGSDDIVNNFIVGMTSDGGELNVVKYEIKR